MPPGDVELKLKATDGGTRRPCAGPAVSVMDGGDDSTQTSISLHADTSLSTLVYKDALLKAAVSASPAAQKSMSRDVPLVNGCRLLDSSDRNRKSFSVS